MSSPLPIRWFREHLFTISGGLLLLLLLFKFLWPLGRFDVPLGYDAGIYRYLFLRYAGAWPPFSMPALEPWAREHPLGLFLFSTVLLKLGIPVDSLIGWVWHLFPIVLLLVLSWVSAKKWGFWIGALTLLMGFLSVAFYDGFIAVYWKTYAALLWMVLSFHFLEERRFVWGTFFGALTVMTHHQTGLLFGLVLGTWFFLSVIPVWTKKISYQLPATSYQLLTIVLIFLFTIVLSLPVLREAFLQHIPTLLKLWNAPGGNFPPPLFYLRITGMLLLLGIMGFALSFKKERGSLFQLAVLWSGIFVIFHLMFYRRFFLQLDFFLLPFAALFTVRLWGKFPTFLVRGSLVFLILVQGILSTQAAAQRVPDIDPRTFSAIEELHRVLSRDALVLALDNTSPPYLRGWLPHHRVGGPGLFDSSWSYEQWERFLLGSHEERLELLRTLDGPVFLFASPYFHNYYREHAGRFLGDECFEAMEQEFVYRVKGECLSGSF